MIGHSPMASYRSPLPLIAFSLSILLCACAPHPPTSPPRAGNRPFVDAPYIEQAIHKLINRERAQQGLPELGFDARLSHIARTHSRDMAIRGYFAHKSPERADFSDRYREAGYGCSVLIGSKVFLGAENLALNSLYSAVTRISGKVIYDWNSVDVIAQTTVRGWMESAGHRENIPTPYFRQEGIGVHVGYDGRVLITQNFC